MIIIEWFLNKYLPVYIRFWPSYYWLAMWSAPIRYNNKWKVNGEWVPCCRHDSYLEALRITIRKGPAHSKIIKVIKKGVI